MVAGKKQLCAAIAIFVALTAPAARAQFISNSRPAQPAPGNEAVQYLFPEQVHVPAGKAAPVALHFRVAQGLHINSHTPSDDYLIPTGFSIPDGMGVRLAAANYPAGVDITLPSDPKTRLNVYTGEFVIQARIVATRGDHLVKAKLRYQACDQRQCMPPKTIPVALDVIGQ